MQRRLVRRRKGDKIEIVDRRTKIQSSLRRLDSVRDRFRKRRKRPRELFERLHRSSIFWINRLLHIDRRRFLTIIFQTIIFR